MQLRSLAVLVLAGAGAVLLWTRASHMLPRWLGGAEQTGHAPMTDQARHVDRAGNTQTDQAGAPLAVPLAPPGRDIEIILNSEPAAWYGAPGSDDANDLAYRDLVAEVAGDLGMDEVRHDPALSRAAREVAYQTGVLGFAPPEAALSFLLHAHGAPEMTAGQFFTHTTSEDESVVSDTLRRALAGSPKGRGPVRVGVGEVATPGQSYTRHVSVLVARRDYDIEPAPRQVAPGGLWMLEGELAPGYRDLEASVLYPDGRIARAELQMQGQRFVIRAPAGDVPGTMHVDLAGADERGPGKIMQLAVEVGRAPPDRVHVRVPERDPEFASLEQAETYALMLLNRDRQLAGLAPLVADPALAAIARAHSQDMRDNGFFAHRSPTTGLLGDRLVRAGYRAIAHAENLAQNDTLGEAEASLMSSVGHRKNILSLNVSHAGVGVVRRDQGERTEWFVTQVFARPVVMIDAAAARIDLLARINTARAARGAAALTLDSAISTVAQRHARTVARGAFAGVAKDVIADLEDVNAGMSVAVNAIYDLAGFAPPEAALAAGVARVGIGVMQSPDDPQGRTGVIVVAVMD